MILMGSYVIQDVFYLTLYLTQKQNKTANKVLILKFL